MAESGSQNAAVRKIEIEMDSYRTHWQVAWERKASWELKSRLRQWGNVLKEIRIDPEENSRILPLRSPIASAHQFTAG